MFYQGEQTGPDAGEGRWTPGPGRRENSAGPDWPPGAHADLQQYCRAQEGTQCKPPSREVKERIRTEQKRAEIGEEGEEPDEN